MNRQPSRRTFLAASGVVAGAAMLSKSSAHANVNDPSDFHPRYCLNTSTIRGQQLPLDKIVDLSSQAGYTAIEPWIGEIQKFAQSGGNLKDLGKRISDSGLTVESAIGFANWIVDDDEKRAKGLERMKRDMDVLRQIGGIRIAAPPVGATNQNNLDLRQAAKRYHAILELGKSMEVIPELELWGFSQSLRRLGELMFVAVESGHADACLLPDVYHIYKGGSDFLGLRLINGKSIQVMHMNDYPDIARAKIGDADRVYPGDGVAPVKQILTDLKNAGFNGVLSLELFNRSYWKQDPLEVLKTGLRKMQESVALVS